MDMGFAVTCQLARHRRPHHPVLVHRPVSLLHASFGPYLTVTPLRFATLHLHQVGTGLSPVAAEHARRTIGIGGRVASPPPSRPGEFHPEPLTEPDLNLSAYPARATHGRLPSSPNIEFLRLPVDSDQYG